MMLFDALVCSAAIVEGCFSTDLRAGWQESIADFRDSLLLLPKAKYPRFSTKFHIVCSHIETWCLRMGGGLARWHEQSFEAAHKDFVSFWQTSYAVTDCTAKRFG